MLIFNSDFIFLNIKVQNAKFGHNFTRKLYNSKMNFSDIQF